MKVHNNELYHHGRKGQKMWIYNDELYHFGVKGMKWGVRKYKPRSIRGAIASYKNYKVDKSFNKWKKNSELRESAIDKGKKANVARVEYETNKNKDTKKAYKQANKEYKKAFSKNTLYRKGQIKSEVSSDMSKKYMQLAKKSEGSKQSRYIDKYNIERAKARRAPSVAAKRSALKASFKRSMTISAKAAVSAAAVYGTAKYLNKKGFIDISVQDLYRYKSYIRIAKNMFGYL